MWLFNKKNDAKKPEEMEESFSVLKGKNGGKPFLATINMSAKNYKWKKQLPWFLGFSIEFKNPTENGLASVEELKDLEKFENNIEKIITSENEFSFVGTSNWNNHRELIYYTTEPKTLAPKLQGMMNSRPEWIFTFQSYHDPKWQSISMFFK